MRKIVRLTESDLTRLVRRVIKEDELSQTDDGKGCVKEIRKLYISNGFHDNGDSSPYSDWSGHHHTDVTYQKKMSYNQDPDYINIRLSDGPDGKFSIFIGSARLTQKEKTMVKHLTNSNNIDSSGNFEKNRLTCEEAKNELFKTIKPFEKLLIQMGWKKML